MFDIIKPGHVLRFSTCPSSIHSPPGVVSRSSTSTDNQLQTAWTNTSSLGFVEIIEACSGVTGDVARTFIDETDIARAERIAGINQDRVVAREDCDFVGFVDGESRYISTVKSTFSKDFSGCLMAAYRVAGQRRIAHVASNDTANMDCKQAFLTARQNENAAQIGWFRPYRQAMNFDKKLEVFNKIKSHIGQQINNLITLGVISSNNRGYAILAFKVSGALGNDWVVADIRKIRLSHSWTVS